MECLRSCFIKISNHIQDMDIKDLIAKLSDLSVSETFVMPSEGAIGEYLLQIDLLHIFAEAALQSWNLRFHASSHFSGNK